MPEILPEALDAARAIQDESDCVKVLSNLASHLPETLLPIALDAVMAVQNEFYRADALSGMIPQLKSCSFNFCFWKESLRILTYRDRKELLGDISELSSVIIELGGSEALAQTACAIQEVGRQWS